MHVRAVRAEYRGAVLDAPEAEVLVWSDLHLGHANIIDYQRRPVVNPTCLWFVWNYR